MHDTEEGRCCGCLQEFGACKFEEPIGDGHSCLRENLDSKMVDFLNNYYKLFSNGIFPNQKNEWLQDAKDIELTEFIKSEYKNYGKA